MVTVVCNRYLISVGRNKEKCEMSQNKKGVLLVFSITALYIAVFSILHLTAQVERRSPVTGWYAAATRGGIEMHGFTVTAYCPGRCCNDIWAGKTATGRSIRHYTDRGISIAAVDPSVIPLGSEFTYAGTLYRAADVGGKIKGRRIDVLLPDHELTLEFGVKKEQKIVLTKVGSVTP
jgi:3D (Asp-Asp-Asp) domain-containing protein